MRKNGACMGLVNEVSTPVVAWPENGMDVNPQCFRLAWLALWRKVSIFVQDLGKEPKKTVLVVACVIHACRHGTHEWCGRVLRTRRKSSSTRTPNGPGEDCGQKRGCL